jgi:dimethylhistidine N-methyltransferase
VPDTKPVQYRLVERPAAGARDEAREVIDGLAATPARVSPKYFYDELGCALYGAICQLPEYYPTRVERALFREKRAEIASRMPRDAQFVDLGAGDCAKACGWLPFVAPSRYIAVDIARDEIERALARLAPDFPGVEMLGVATDFSGTLDLGDVLDSRPAIFFYPGSSIGNFTPAEAVEFLRQVRGYCVERPGSGLLIGVDGKKEKALLDAAYDDALGVTAAFNRNVLLHLNRRFGFDFAPVLWRHLGFYNAGEGRIEMHLEALRDHVVHLADTPRAFRAGERIHTESSYKYTRDDFEALLRAAGFGPLRAWRSGETPYHVFYAGN